MHTLNVQIRATLTKAGGDPYQDEKEAAQALTDFVNYCQDLFEREGVVQRGETVITLKPDTADLVNLGR